MINTFSQESLHISIKGFTRTNDMCYVVTARLHLTERSNSQIGDNPWEKYNHFYELTYVKKEIL
jgi:hypothetical protein